MSRRTAPRLAALACVLALAGCARPDAPGAAGDAVLAPAREAWNVRFTVLDGGRPRARVDAGYMASYETDSLYSVLRGDSAAGTPVTVGLFDAAGRPSATLTARRVVYDETNRRFVATGNVVVRTTGARTLLAERVVWLEADRRVRAPGFVRYTSPNERAEGYDLDADETLATYRLARVTANVVVE